jgi:hypothetical protein
MGDLKNKALNNTNEDVQEHQLTDGEANFLRLLNLALAYHTMGQKIMSGFLYIICTERLGYQDGVNLQFKFDFDKQDNKLEVTLLPETVSPPTPPAEAPQA